MKNLAGFFMAIALFCFMVPALNAQDNTIMQNTQPTVKDSSTIQTGTSTIQQNRAPQTQNQIGTQSPQMNQTMSSTSPGVRDLSGLDQKPGADVLARFNTVAEQRAKDIQQKLGLDESKTKDIKESLMNYFKDEWKSRIALDQKKGDAGKVKDINEDLSDQRVHLGKEISGKLNDQQKAQWQNLAVDWWTSLDKSIFDIQQNESSMLSRNSGTNNKNNQQ